MNFMEQAFEDWGVEREQKAKDEARIIDITKITYGTITSFYRNRNFVYLKFLETNCFSIENDKNNQTITVTVLGPDDFEVRKANAAPITHTQKELGRTVLALCGSPND